MKRIAKSLTVMLLTLVMLTACGGKEEEYNANINEFLTATDHGMALSVETTYLAEDVWNNAIKGRPDDRTDKYTIKPQKKLKTYGYREVEVNDFYDFDTALANMYADPEIVSAVDAIKSNQTEVDALYLDLQSPPKGMEQKFELVDSLYDLYKQYTNLAISPTGNYNTYSQETISIPIEFQTEYEKLTLLLSTDKK